MISTSVTVATSGAASAIVVLDQYNDSFNVGVQVVVSTPSTGTMVVQYTLDDPFAVYATNYSSTATWFSTAFTNITTTTAGALTTPARALRLNSTLFSTGALATLTVVQASNNT